MSGKNSAQTVFAHITIGLQLAITMLLFVYGGYRIDVHYQKTPLFVTLGAVLGMVIGFYQLIRELSKIDKKIDKKNHLDQSGGEPDNAGKTSNKVKWM